MTDRVIRFLEFHRKREYRNKRREIVYPEIKADKFMQAAVNFAETVKAECPVLYPDDIFGFNRSVRNVCKFSIDSELNNFTPDYEWAISNGLGAIKTGLERRASAVAG